MMSEDSDWSNMPLEAAVRSILGPPEGVVEHIDGITGARSKRLHLLPRPVKDIVELLSEHPDLVARPSFRARTAAVRKVLNSDPRISSIGSTADRRYVYTGDITDTTLLIRRNMILRVIISNGGEFTFDPEEQYFSGIKMVFSDGEKRIEHPLLPELQALADAGFIELDGYSARISPSMWFAPMEPDGKYLGPSKVPVSFTVSERFDILLRASMDSLLKNHVKRTDNQGWLLDLSDMGVTAPVHMSNKGVSPGWPLSKSQIIELALISFLTNLEKE